MKKQTLCDRCMKIGVVSGYVNVCSATCPGGRLQKQRIEDAEAGDF